MSATWPDLTEVNGCILRADRYSPENFAAWWREHSGDRWRIEDVVNELHLYDLVGDDYDDGQLGELEEIARRMADAWTGALAVKFPDRSFHVRLATEPGEYGPTLSFHQSSGCPGCQTALEFTGRLGAKPDGAEAQ
jgi:hypothetical protein